MPATEYLNPDTLPNPGGRYNQIVKKGNMVFIAGQTAVDKDGNIVGVGDPAAQADNAMRCVEPSQATSAGAPVYSSSTAWKLLPPKPNALTLDRRGWPFALSHGRVSVLR